MKKIVQSITDTSGPTDRVSSVPSETEVRAPSVGRNENFNFPILEILFAIAMRDRERVKTTCAVEVV